MSELDRKLPPAFFLETAAQLEPFGQGRLDRLCGLYAIVNALRLAVPTSARESRTLFEAGIAFLEDKGWLSAVLVEGMPTRQFVSLARYMFAEHQRRIGRSMVPERIAVGRGNRSAVEFAALEAVTCGMPLLLLIDGPLNHYSVLCGFTPSRLRLFDSYGYQWLSRRHCGFGRYGVYRHRLHVWVAK